MGLVAEMLNLQRYEVVDSCEEDGAVFVKLLTKPEVGLWVPRPLQKRLGGELEFYDVVQASAANPALHRAASSGAMHWCQRRCRHRLFDSLGCRCGQSW